MSFQYSGTGALKTDYTRTGKRSLKGAIQDGINSLTRYYLNNLRDGKLYSHTCDSIGHNTYSVAVLHGTFIHFVCMFIFVCIWICVCSLI